MDRLNQIDVAKSHTFYLTEKEHFPKVVKTLYELTIFGPLEKIHWKSKYRSISEETTLKAGFEEDIAMVWSHPGLKIEDWENITSKKKGIVIAGTGLGHIKSELLDSIKATSKDMPVAMATQCFSGSTNLNVYSNGRELLKRGVVETYDTLPETALVKMMWLSKHHPNDVRELMGKNLVGELSNSRKLG